jgi:hypothetical protein
MYHICYSNPDAWQYSYQTGIYGNVATGNDNLKVFWGKIVDLVALRPGDKIFFYVKNDMVLHGVFEVMDEPYYHESELFNNPRESYPFRFNFLHSKNFDNPIPVSELAKLIENGHISSITTFERDANSTFRGIRQLTNQEGKIIEDTFVKFNPKGNISNVQIYDHREIVSTAEALSIISNVNSGDVIVDPIKIELNFVSTTRVNARKHVAQYENSLQGYIFYCIRRALNNVVGDLHLNNFSECLMEVPLLRAQQFKSDILCIYRNHEDAAHFFTIIETKKKKEITIEDLSQLIGYMKTFSSSKNIDFNSIEGLYISDSFHPDAIQYLRNRRSVEKENPIRLIEYAVDRDGRVTFNTISI